MMLSWTRALLPASVAAALMVVGMAFLAVGQGVHAAPRWSQVVGDGVVFPACGSANAVATCVNSAGNISLSWDFSAGVAGGGVTSLTLTDPNGAWLVNQTYGGLTGAVEVPGLGLGTYTYQLTPLYNIGNGTAADPSGGASGSIYVPNCATPAPALSISKTELSPGAGTIVHPGDTISYRMYVAAWGADQSGVQVRDHIPGGTTMVWQGGGTDTNSSAQIAGGVDGFGDAWWYQYTTPASGWNSYVDFTTVVSDNFFSYYPPGSQVCNVATIQSQQIGAIGSNTICNAVGPNNPAWIAGVCDANGYASIQWASSLGATAYYPRLWIPSGSCPSGWTMWSDNHTCYINGYTGGTSVIVAGLAPGAYSAWVLAGEPVDWDSPPPGTSFTCPAPAAAAVQGYKVLMPGNQVAEPASSQTVTVSGVSSSSANPYGISVNAGNTYTVSVSPLTGYTIGYTLCIDRIDCHTSTPTIGTSASVTLPSGEGHYADLWWHYTPSTLPDLTASAVAPATATAGTATTFSATISNANAATGVQFKNLFQRANDANGTGATDIITTAFTGPLTAGASLVASGSYTFSTAGTFYMRACADKDWSGGAGWVVESNEANNCGPWTAVTVTVPNSGPPPSCSPPSQSIATGGTANWTASGGSGSPFRWFDALDNAIGSGSSFSKSYGTTGTYAVYVEDSAGTESTSCQVTVGCSGLSASIDANPTRFPTGGGNTTVSWSASGVSTSCFIKEDTTTIDTISGASCSIPDGSTDRPVTEQTRYCISCDGDDELGEPGYDCVTVNVNSQFVPF